MKIFLNFVVLSFLLFLSCEKLVGYKYDAKPATLSAIIHGKVTNVYNQDSVVGATVWFNNQQTQTDKSGNYFLQYFLGTDEDRDRPVNIRVTAENYIDYSDTRVIYPKDTMVNILMEYAAPKIEKIAIVPFMNDDELIYVFQVEITEYQGINTITIVKATLDYHKMHETQKTTVEKELVYVRPASPNSGYFQSVFPAGLADDWIFESGNSFELLVEDEDGFSDFIREAYSAGRMSAPIFPVEIQN